MNKSLQQLRLTSNRSNRFCLRTLCNPRSRCLPASARRLRGRTTGTMAYFAGAMALAQRRYLPLFRTATSALATLGHANSLIRGCTRAGLIPISRLVESDLVTWPRF